MGPTCTIGLDFGTASARALAVDVATGEELAASVYEYRHGESGVLGDPADPNVARQEPRDYVDGLEATLAETAAALAEIGAHVVGVGCATTGSTPLPLDRNGRPLAFQRSWADNPAAKAWLWKDHTSHAEAAEITDVFREHALPYLDYVGGTYSSEWFWAKILRCARTDREVFAAAHTWCELSDFIPAVATGTGIGMRRNACAAGHKALFAARWGGLPAAEALQAVDAALASLRPRLYDSVSPADASAGRLDSGVARRSGLAEDVVVAVGTFDAHAGAVAGGVRPGRLVKIMGTSTCDCTVTTTLDPVPGVCGVVVDSVIPGMVGVEAGQSAVGDLFDWFLGVSGRDHAELSEEAARLRPGESGLLALDWNNGNRTVLVDPLLGGLLVGQSLATTSAEIYRALVEATAYGSRVIVERIEEHGVPIIDIVVSGSVTMSPLAMQIYADVLDRPIRIARSSNASAAGAAINAAVAAGAHPSVAAAQAAMAGPSDTVFMPHRHHVATYERLYHLYRHVHDAFAAHGALGNLMKELIEIRSEARA